jgi:hypothetical protein
VWSSFASLPTSSTFTSFFLHLSHPIKISTSFPAMSSTDTPEPALPTPADGARREAPATDNVEEGRKAYRPGGLHSVYIGDVYADKYEVLNKIGYGLYSTV